MATPCDALVNPTYVKGINSGALATTRHEAPPLNVATRWSWVLVKLSVTATPGSGPATTLPDDAGSPGTTPPSQKVAPPLLEKYARTAGGQL